MKSISMLISTIVILTITNSIQKHKLSTKLKTVKKNKMTPKVFINHYHHHHYKPLSLQTINKQGVQLSNHYGANPYSNPYGPHPELLNRDAYIKNPDGSVARKRIRIIKNLPYSAISCDITQKENYYSCMNIRDCDLCSAAEHCGWCELQKLCLPGDSKETACPGNCINGWVFDKQNCDSIVKSGYLGNFDPYNTEKVETVEYAYPKYKVDSVITTPEVIVTPLLLGTQSETHQQQQKDVDNDRHVVKDQTISVNKPIYGELRQVRNVNTHQTQYLDAVTGLRVDHFGQSNLAFHGTEEENIISDPDNDYDPIDNLQDRKIFAKKKENYY